MIRRGTVYGPPLPDSVLEDDGADRGLMFAFVGAHIGRQFEFVQSEWINDGVFFGGGDDKDPIIGSSVGGVNFTVPRRPVRKRCVGLNSLLLAAANTASCRVYGPFAGSANPRKLKVTMIRSTRARWITPTVLQLLVCAFHMVVAVQAQVRGVYPLGMSATNSGVTPDAGFTYSNQLLIYSRNKSKNAQGTVVATGNNSIVMDMNTLAWVSERKILGGASFSMSATFPFANNSLTSDIAGHISGGGGFAGVCNRSIQSRQDVDSGRGGKVAIGFASVGCCFI